jgi:hypothetical protein
MSHALRPALLALSCALAMTACGSSAPPATPPAAPPAAETTNSESATMSYAEQHAGELASVKLTADLSGSRRNTQDAGQARARGRADEPIFWKQWYGDRAALMAKITDEPTRRYAR